MSLPVGVVVRLKIPILGNPVGSLGVCYEEYKIGDSCGSSFIFQNGCYDGFNENEQDLFLEVIKDSGFRYIFTSVIKLSNDFREGRFDKALALKC